MNGRILWNLTLASVSLALLTPGVHAQRGPSMGGYNGGVFPIFFNYGSPVPGAFSNAYAVQEAFNNGFLNNNFSSFQSMPPATGVFVNPLYGGGVFYPGYSNSSGSYSFNPYYSDAYGQPQQQLWQQ